MNIQIMKIYKESFHNVNTHKAEWLRVAGGPIILWVVGAIFLAVTYAAGGHSFDVANAQPEGGALYYIGHIVYGILYFIAMFSLYINGYRYAVLQEGGEHWFTLNLNMRFVKLILYSILIGILSGIFVAVSGGILYAVQSLIDNTFVSVIVGILLGIYAFYLIFRVTLYPLLISIDQSEPLRTSWNLMKGNILRFLGLVILVALTIILVGAVGAIILGLLTWALGFISDALAMLSLILWMLFGIFMTLFAWAVNSKVMGLVFTELSTNRIR